MGSSAVASDMSKSIKPYLAPHRPVKCEIGALSDQHWSVGAGGATVRRQSIASTRTENCATRQRHRAINDWRPYETPFSSRRLAISHIPLPSQYKALEIVAAFAAKDEQVTTERMCGAPHIHSRPCRRLDYVAARSASLADSAVKSDFAAT